MIAGTYAGLRWGRLRPAIPRASGFNGGIVSDCPRFARAFANVSTPYACLSLIVRIYVTRFARGSFYCNTPCGVLY